MEKYTSEMRGERMKEVPAEDGKSVAPLSKSSEVISANAGGKKEVPDFKDAGDFLRGGGKVDGEMSDIGSAGSLPKGTPAPGVPSLEKGSPAPQGPGVI